MMSRRLLGATAAIAALIACASCGTPPSVAGTSEVPADDALPAPANLDAPLTPIIEVVAGGMSSAERETAIDAEISRCMEAEGLVYTARSFTDSEPVTRRALVEYRSEHGYGVWNPPVSSITAETDPNVRRLSEMTESDVQRYLDALEGHDRSESGEPGGCVATATKAIDQSLPPAREREAAVRFAADHPDLGDADRRYGECMASRGHPDLLSSEDARALASDSKSLEAELDIAVADVACLQLTVWPVWDTLGGEFSQALAVAN